MGNVSQVSDEQLWQMLDTPGAWLVCTDAGLLRPQHSLREALWQAWTESAEGGRVTSILKLPDSDTVIEASQVRRLTSRLVQTSHMI
jgi:hypothetical protein